MAETSLKDKVAIITGAATGIGKEIAKKLAEHGAKVALLDIKMEHLLENEKRIKAKNECVMAIQCDVREKQQVFEAVEKARKQLGPIDILVNNAATVETTPDLDIDECLKIVDVNINGYLRCYSACIPDMMNRKSGHIINISSITGRTALQGFPIYTGTKYFIQGYSVALRHKLVSHGVKLTVIQPGIVDTPIRDNITPCMLSMAAPKEIPQEDYLQAEDVAEAVVYALTQKDGVGINEIMIEPKNAPGNLH